MTMPTGWMDSETALLHARRGAWAYRMGDNGKASIYAAVSVADMRSVIGTHESWKFLAPHPDDEPAAGTVEIEAWVVVGGGDAGTVTFTYAGEGEARDHAKRFRDVKWPAKVVHLTGYTTPPTPEAAETVRGVSRE